MTKAPIRKTEYFAARRLTALWLFACILWLSAAAPFGHTCTSNASDRHSASISSGVTCASCQWFTVERSTYVDAPAAAPKPLEIAAVFVARAESAALQTFHSVSSRGPPV